MFVLGSKNNFSKRILGLLLKISVHKCDQSFRSKLSFQFTSTEGQNGLKMTRKRKIYLCTGVCPLLVISAKGSPTQWSLQSTSSFTLVGCGNVFHALSLVNTQENPIAPSSLQWLHWCCPATVLRMLLTCWRSLAMPILLIEYAWAIQYIVTTAV